MLLDAMQAELARTMDVLGDQPVPPYFLSYEVTDFQNVSASGAFGTLTSTNRGRGRSLDVDIRVGDYALDNTRRLREGRRQRRVGTAVIPLDDDADAIRGAIWRQTDRLYKDALEQFAKVKTEVEVKVAPEDAASDFSEEPSHRAMHPPAHLDVSATEWEAKVQRYTAPFAAAAEGHIYRGNASFNATAETRYLVTSEGTRLRTGKRRYSLSISARTIAES